MSGATTASGIRTTLYVPGDREERFDKAIASGADSIIIDLEDAVAEERKDEALDNARRWLGDRPGAPAWVRVNNRPDRFADEVSALAATTALGIVIPKADLASCTAVTSTSVALIETATGVVEANALAALPHVSRLALGEADLAASLGIDPSPDDREFAAVRSTIVVASAAAGLLPPVGPVFTDIDDEAGLVASCEQLRRQGFGGRSIIHPRQVDPVHQAFRPADARIEWARRVLDAYAEAGGQGTALVDGEFVDAAVARRASAILAAADSR